MSVDSKSVGEKVKKAAFQKKKLENTHFQMQGRLHINQLYQSIDIYYERWRRASRIGSLAEIKNLAKELEEFCNLISFKSLPMQVKRSFRELSYTVKFFADPESQFWLEYIKTNSTKFQPRIQPRIGCSVCKTVSNRQTEHERNKMYVNSQAKISEKLKAAQARADVESRTAVKTSAAVETRTETVSKAIDEQKTTREIRAAMEIETVAEPKIAAEHKASSKSPDFQPVVTHHSSNGVLCFTPTKPKSADDHLQAAAGAVPPTFELSELSGSKPPLQYDNNHGNFVLFSSPVTSDKYFRLKQQNKELSDRMQQLIADIAEKDLALKLEIQKRDKLKSEFLQAREKLENSDKKLRGEIEKAQEERLKISNLLVKKAELELANDKMLLQNIQDQKEKEQLRSELCALQKELASKKSPTKSIMTSPLGNRPPFK